MNEVVERKIIGDVFPGGQINRWIVLLEKLSDGNYRFVHETRQPWGTTFCVIPLRKEDMPELLKALTEFNIKVKSE